MLGAIFGAWSLGAIWALIISSFSIATVVGVIALAIAILEPAIVAALIPDLRKWAIVVAVIAFGYSAVFTKGMDYGLSVKQTQWDTAAKQEVVNGNAARSKAVATVRNLPSNSVRHDGWNRDNWKQPVGK
jgi:hypothetical protein